MVELKEIVDDAVTKWKPVMSVALKEVEPSLAEETGPISPHPKHGRGDDGPSRGLSGPGTRARRPAVKAPPSSQPDLRGYVYLALMVFFGSTTSPFAKVAVSELPIGVLPLLRFGFATLCLSPFLADRGALRRLLRGDWPRLAAVAALCVPINQGFFLNAA